MKQDLPSSILEAVKKKAEEKHPSTYFDGTIQRDDMLFPLKRELFLEHYKDAIEMMLGFDMWRAYNYEPIEPGNLQGLWRDKHTDVLTLCTTIQLLEKYLETVK